MPASAPDTERKRERSEADIAKELVMAEAEDEYGAPVIANLDEFESQLRDGAVNTSDDVLKNVMRAQSASGSSKLHRMASGDGSDSVAASASAANGVDASDSDVIMLDAAGKRKRADARSADDSKAGAVPATAAKHVYQKKGAMAAKVAGKPTVDVVADVKKRKTLLTFDMEDEA